MALTMFNDRDEAGWMLVERLRGEAVEKPIVLAIPRGGIEVGAALARGLGCELDVVLSRKLRAPHQPELALGAVSETGEVYLNHFAAAMTDALEVSDHNPVWAAFYPCESRPVAGGMAGAVPVRR